jgi:hypothetical protein
VALRDVHRRESEAPGSDGAGDGDRGGLQCLPLQFGPRRDDPAFAFLVSFVKNVLRYSVSQDVIILSLHAVKDDLKATDEQMRAFQSAILGWWKNNKIYPDGF